MQQRLVIFRYTQTLITQRSAMAAGHVILGAVFISFLWSHLSTKETKYYQLQLKTILLASTQETKFFNNKNLLDGDDTFKLSLSSHVVHRSIHSANGLITHNPLVITSHRPHACKRKYAGHLQTTTAITWQHLTFSC